MVDLGIDNIRAISDSVILPSVIIITVSSLSSFCVNYIWNLIHPDPSFCIEQQLWYSGKTLYIHNVFLVSKHNI